MNHFSLSLSNFGQINFQIQQYTDFFIQKVGLGAYDGHVLHYANMQASKILLGK